MFLFIYDLPYLCRVAFANVAMLIRRKYKAIFFSNCLSCWHWAAILYTFQTGLRLLSKSHTKHKHDISLQTKQSIGKNVECFVKAH